MKAIGKMAAAVSQASGFLKEKTQKTTGDVEVIDHLAGVQEEAHKTQEALIAQTEKEAIAGFVKKVLPSGYEFFKGFDRVIDMVCSPGHMRFHKLVNWARYDMGKQPARILATALLVIAGLPALYVSSPKITSAILSTPGVIVSTPGSILSYFSGAKNDVSQTVDNVASADIDGEENLFGDETAAQPEETVAESQNSAPFDLQAWAVSFIIDYDTGAKLPDGQTGHIRWSFAKNTPLRSGFTGGSAEFKDFAEKALSLEAVAAENAAKTAQMSNRLAQIDNAEKTRANDTQVWNAWLRAKNDTVELDDVGLPIVPVDDFWKSDANLEAMATTGVVAKSDTDGSIVAAAYVDGTPSLNIFGANGCQNVFGLALDEACKTIKKDALEPPVVLQQMYGVIEAAKAKTAQIDVSRSVSLTTVPDRWYLNLPNFGSDQPTLTSDEFNIASEFVSQNVTSKTTYWTKFGGALNSDTWTLATNIKKLPVLAPLKGLWKSPEAIKAMETRGVVAKISDESYLLAASVAGIPTARILQTNDNTCITVFGDAPEDCKYGDVSRFETALKTAYASPDAKAELADLTFYSKVPFRGDSAFKDGNEYNKFFNTVLTDYENHGGTTIEQLKKWKNGVWQARPVPASFLENAKALAALSNKGIYITPEDSKNLYMVGAYVDGKLQLDIVELRGNSLYCQTVVGEKYVPDCQQGDFGPYSELIKSMFKKEN